MITRNRQFDFIRNGFDPKPFDEDLFPHHRNNDECDFPERISATL